MQSQSNVKVMCIQIIFVFLLLLVSHAVIEFSNRMRKFTNSKKESWSVHAKNCLPTCTSH